MKDTILNIVRAILITAGGALAAKGYGDSATTEQAVGGIIALVGAVWTAIAHKKALDTPVPSPEKK